MIQNFVKPGKCGEVCLFIKYHSVGWNGCAKKGKLSVFRASRYTRSRNLRKIIQRARVGYLLIRCPLSAPSSHVLNLCSVLKLPHPPSPSSPAAVLPICLAHETTGPLPSARVPGPSVGSQRCRSRCYCSLPNIKSFLYPPIDNIICHRLNNGYVLANAQRIVFVE